MEIWKNINKEYQVSNLGRVKSKYRKGTYGKTIKQRKDKHGYLIVYLSKNGKSKPVIQLSLNGDIIKVWTCAREAERTKGFDRSCISKCCLNKAKQYKGYMWRFLET